MKMVSQLATKELVTNNLKQQFYAQQHQNNQDNVSINDQDLSLFTENGEQDPNTRDVVILHFENQYKDTVKYNGTRIFIDGEVSEIVKQKVFQKMNNFTYKIIQMILLIRC